MASDSVNISVYLLKSSRVADFRAEVLAGPGAIALVAGLDGVFLPLTTPPRPPVWAASVLQMIADPAALNITSQSAGGLLVISKGNYTFVICFGHAWLRLKSEWLEHDFGRRVALNAIPKDQLLEVNAEQVFAKWHLARERAPRATDLYEFGIESERDLVSAVEGIPKDKLLGAVLRGGTSVRLKVSLKTLPSVLDRMAALYRSNRHQKEWPELHNLTPIADPDLIEKLDQKLDADLVAGRGAANIVLFAPSLRKEDYLPAESYVFGRLTKSCATAPYLLFGSWEGALRAKRLTPTVAAAKDTPVHLLDDAHEEIAQCRVYECFGYETALNSRQYILSSGVWYEAGNSFVASINAKVNGLPKPAAKLLAWDKACSEGEYNLKCAAHDKTLLHFDAKNVMYGGGQSKFELCDLMHPKSKTMYFAKIPTSSSAFSHLIEQTRRTVELMFSPDGDFRKSLKAKMAKTHPGVNPVWLDARPRSGDWNLCLVSLGKSANRLPFFAKCGLVRLVRELEERGHPISYLEV
jgi:uncharacterized protein (TIGR04141 family)